VSIKTEYSGEWHSLCSLLSGINVQARDKERIYIETSGAGLFKVSSVPRLIEILQKAAEEALEIDRASKGDSPDYRRGYADACTQVASQIAGMAPAESEPES